MDDNNNQLIHSSNSLNPSSTFKNTLRNTVDDYFQQVTHHKKDYKKNNEKLDLLSSCISLDKNNCQSINYSIWKNKKLLDEELIIKPQNNDRIIEEIDERLNSLRKNEDIQVICKSNLKSKITITNKIFISKALGKIKDIISQLTNLKQNLKIKYKELSTEKVLLKQKKNDIILQLENKIAQKESYEEIYQYNLSTYSSLKDSYNNRIHLTSDNIIVLKKEVLSMTIEQYKHIISMILNDLSNSNNEIIFDNLIETAITKCFHIINFNINLEPDNIDLFIDKLSKEIYDIYPMHSKEVINVLLKYSIKQQYIDKTLEKDMLYINKEYKTNKENCKLRLIDLENQLSICELQLKEVKIKEMNLSHEMSLLLKESIQNVSIVPYSKIAKTQRETSNKDINKIEKNKGNNNSVREKPIGNYLPLQKKTIETVKSEDEFKSNKQIIEHSSPIKVNKDENDPIISEKTNINSDKSTLHSSFSNTGKPFITNKFTTLFALDKNDNFQIHNKLNTNKSIQQNSIEVNLQLSSKEKCQIANSNESSNFPVSINHHDNSNKCDLIELATKTKTERQWLNQYNRSSSSHMILHSNNYNLLQLNFPKLDDTYCYYKNTNDKEEKYNPLNSQSSSPDILGYIKGFLSFNRRNSTLILSSSLENKTISVSKIKKTAVFKPFKDIICIYQLYHKMLRGQKEYQVKINQFIKRKELNHIELSSNDKIKGALCSLFSFTLFFNVDEMIEILFVSYTEFRMWLNGLGCLINNK